MRSSPAAPKAPEAAFPRVNPRSAVVLALMLIVSGCASSREKLDIPELPGIGLSSGTLSGTYARLTTDRGEILVRLLPAQAPKTVENFIALASGKREWTDPKTKRKTSRRLYDGTRFFSATPGFVLRGGDPLGDGSGGPGYSIVVETDSLKGFGSAGIVGMAVDGESSSGSQFFITLDTLPWLTGKHTVFGRVVEGMDVVRDIASAVEKGPAPVLKTARIENR